MNRQHEKEILENQHIASKLIIMPTNIFKSYSSVDIKIFLFVDSVQVRCVQRNTIIRTSKTFEITLDMNLNLYFAFYLFCSSTIPPSVFILVLRLRYSADSLNYTQKSSTQHIAKQYVCRCENTRWPAKFRCRLCLKESKRKQRDKHEAVYGLFAFRKMQSWLKVINVL